MAIVCLIGTPGVGKSTITNRLKTKYAPQYKCASTGEMLRLNKVDIKNLAQGEMGPEDIVRKYAHDLMKTERYLVLDGFPRTIEQIKLMQEWLGDAFQNVFFMDIYASEERIRRSILENPVCEECGKMYDPEWISTPCPCGGIIGHWKKYTPQMREQIWFKRKLGFDRERRDMVDFVRGRVNWFSILNDNVDDAAKLISHIISWENIRLLKGV